MGGLIRASNNQPRERRRQRRTSVTITSRPPMTSVPGPWKPGSLLALFLLALLPFFWPPEAGAHGAGYARVGLFNDTPNYQLSISIDGKEPCILNAGDCRDFDLGDEAAAGEHELVAKAYVHTKYLGKRRIGKDFAMTFEMNGEEKRSPLGRVGWYHVFTFRDFLPGLASTAPGPGRKTGAMSFKASYKWCLQQGPARSWKKKEFEKLIRHASEKYAIPAALLAAVIEVESGFNPEAVSPKGALGLMQLMPATCTRFQVRRPFDPEENIEGGAKYLGYLLHQWSTQFPSYSRLEFSLAAYHAGEGRVERYGGIPPFKETEKYIRRVLRRYNTL